jgi:hypothetical protein
MQKAKFLENLVNAKPTPFLFGALGWTIAWQLQLLLQQLIPALAYELGVALIFLPAGIRTLSVLVFGFRGAVGVFLGCIFSTIEYMGHLPTLDASIMLIICAISAFSAYLMMQLVCWWRKIGSDLEELRFSDVLLIVFSQGLLSASLHQLVFSRMHLEGAYSNASIWDTFRLWAAMATGDIVGSMVFMLSGIALANLGTKLLRASRQD